MKETDPKHYHKLYGVKKPRISYQKKDFLDYTIMTAITACVIYFAYGSGHVLANVGLFLCVLMVFVFLVRHGCEFRLPVILKRPQDVLYMFIYKIQNMKAVYIFAVGLFLLENYIIFLTPNLPHNVELTREVAIYLFYIHFLSICLYRTAILFAHLRKRAFVKEVLMQTSWKSFLSKQPNITLEIFHAYFTGILTHIVLITPWYIAITYFHFSMIFLPIICIINVLTHLKYIKVYNSWFYRDHWLGHNSELEFLYLHGTHHDVIPSGLIGVSGNGYLEGLMRHTLGHPTPFYNPVIAFMLYTLEVQQDINNHQYIPGIFPKLSRRFHETCQHSTHHFGRLEPYSVALKSRQATPSKEAKKSGFKVFPEEVVNSIRLDEQLTDFKWDNSRYRHFLSLFDKYQK